MNPTKNPIFVRFILVLATLLVLAGCGRDGQIYDDNLHVRHGMLKLLWTEQYAELDRALDEQYRLYQDGKLKAAAFVSQLWTLQMADKDHFSQRFDAWVAARPDSRWASLAQGLFFLQAAWNARGQDVAARTPEHQMAAMREWAQRAVATLRRAADNEVSPALYGGGLIGAGMLLGDSSGSEGLMRAALDADPKIWMAPIAYFQQLYPQWGGSEEAMLGFIDEIRGQHPQLAARLDADVWWRRGLDDETSGRIESAMVRYESAIAIYPHADALKNLGEIYVRAGRCKDAEKVLETNLEKNDPWDLWTIEMLHQAQTCNGDSLKAMLTMGKRDELIRRYREGI